MDVNNNLQINFEEIEQSFDNLMKIHGKLLAQDKLNIINRKRTSLFPWRGQFSPELIEYLLCNYASNDSLILDPFVGSGTTLFESLRLNLSCYGSEINPAAFYFANMAKFGNLEVYEREQIIKEVNLLFNEYICPNKIRLDCIDKDDILSLLKETSSEYSFNFIVTAIMLAMGKTGSNLNSLKLKKACLRLNNIIKEIPLSHKQCEVLANDARKLNLTDDTIDLIITSPPYINVFNYHQNYRKAMEIIGHNPLEFAPSEIGSNRKHRGNRFFTVVQYCIDMALTLSELHRLLKPNSKLIIVVGRESNVRGVSFKNSLIILILALAGSCFKLDITQERRFKNKYGENIYEDILILNPNKISKYIYTQEFGREIGVWVLKKAYDISLNKMNISIINDIKQAIESSEKINPSPYIVNDLPWTSKKMFLG